MFRPSKTLGKIRTGKIARIVQFETPQALDHMDEIAPIDGVNLLFMGPGDLSMRHSESCTAQWNDLVGQ